MSEEPDQKRAKLDKGDATESKASSDPTKSIQESLEKLDKVQDELNSLNNKSADEIVQIEKKYSTLRKPHFNERANFIEKIPNFWLTAFINHPLVRSIVSEDEEECLHYLNKVDVSEEFTDEKHIFTFKFLFDVNPFFENDELVKEYSVPSGVDAIGTCTATKITWKPGKKLTSDMQDPSSQTFFDWFNDTSDPVNDEIADIIKDDLWANPLQYYLSPIDDDSVDSDLSDEDGVHTDEDPEGPDAA